MIREYIALQGESIYDILMKTYGDDRGYEPLINLNRDLITNKTRDPNYELTFDFRKGEHLISENPIAYNFNMRTFDLEMDVRNLVGYGSAQIPLLNLGAFPMAISVYYRQDINTFEAFYFAGSSFVTATSVAVDLTSKGRLKFFVNESNELRILFNGQDITATTGTVPNENYVNTVNLELCGISRVDSTKQFITGSVSRVKFLGELWEMNEGQGEDLTSDQGTILKVRSSEYSYNLNAPLTARMSGGSNDVFNGSKFINIDFKYRGLTLSPGNANYMFSFSETSDPKNLTMNFNNGVMLLDYNDGVSGAGQVTYDFGAIENVPKAGIFKFTSEDEGANQRLRFYFNDIELTSWLILFDATNFGTFTRRFRYTTNPSIIDGTQQIILENIRINGRDWYFQDGDNTQVPQRLANYAGTDNFIATSTALPILEPTDLNAIWNFTGFDSIDFQGDVFLWDDEITFTTFSTPSFRQERAQLPNYITREGQSIYDIAVQLYGDLSDGLDKIRNLPLEIENGAVKPGTIIPRTVPVNNIGEQFNDNDVFVATLKKPIFTPVTSAFDYLFDFVFEGSGPAPGGDGLEDELESPLIG